MKTEHKYISYREDKDSYIVTVKITCKGKRQIIQKTFKNLQEAIDYRDSLVSLYNLNPAIVDKINSITEAKEIPILQNAFKEYIEKEVRSRVALSTYSKYNLACNQYSKYLGKMKINEITHEIWQDVFATVQQKKNLSYNYVAEDFRRFRSMYEYYISLDVIKENPLAKKVRLKPTYKTKRRGFTEQEKERFLAEAENYHPVYHFIFSLYFQTGCRRGELLAIQWQDIDFDNKLLYIRRSIGRGTVDGNFREEIGNTKTEGSIRAIPLSDDSIKKFKLLFNSREEKPLPDDFVFKPIYHKVKYEFLSLNSIERVFKEIRDKAGLDKSLGIHCIRHTVASQLLTAGVDLATVCSIGGWTSAKTLLSVYAHSNPQAKAKAMQVLF